MQTVELVKNFAPMVVAVAGNPLFTGLSNLGKDVANWLVILQIPFGAIVAIRAGFKYMNADDPHEKRAVYDRFVRLAIGIGIIGTGPWIIKQLTSYF